MHKRCRAITSLAATLVIGVFAAGVARPAAASDEDCAQCKHVDCLKGLIKQKTALARGYDVLATTWDRLVRVEGAGADAVNFNSIVDAGQRAAFYREMLQLHKSFAEQEDAMASRVGAPAGCDFSAGLSAETDTYETCKINQDSVQRAQQEAPCKQIGDLLAQHEAMHRKLCLVRRNDGTVGDFWRYTATGADGRTVERYFPPLMQTPAGRAREEAAAYRMEIAELQKLLPKAEATCELSFNNVSTSCKIPMPPAGTVEMGQDIAGKVCGDPLTASWTINTVSWVRGPANNRNVDPPWNSDCVAKGSAEERRRAAIYEAGPAGGWMCVYEAGDTPKIHIRYFRLKQCNPNTEQTITVPATRGECHEDAPPTPPPPPDRPIS